MNKQAVAFLQEQLNQRGLNAGRVDGILGPKTLAALAKVEGIPSGWAKKRRAVAFIQLLAKEHGIETGILDGYWGPQTAYAYDVLRRKLVDGLAPEIWRPEERDEVNPNDWPRQTPEHHLFAYYGQVGQNQVHCAVPYPHRLAWKKQTVIQGFFCHEKVHDSLQRVLSRVLDAYGLAEIERLRLDLFGGCLNVRPIRGGTRHSTHSWGIALDYDPERNQLKWGRDRASFAQPEYDRWWELWEAEGWVSLGRARNFDWMHVQAAKL